MAVTRRGYKFPTPNYPLRLVFTGLIGAPVGLFGLQLVFFFIRHQMNESTFIAAAAIWLACFIVVALYVYASKSEASRLVAVAVCILSLILCTAHGFACAYILVMIPKLDTVMLISLLDSIAAGLLSGITSSSLRNTVGWTRYSAVES